MNRVNPQYSNGSHAFDWVVLDMFLVIEAHGQQHYQPVTFGGISQEEASDRLAAQRHRDDVKAQAAIDAGFTYIVIPYTDYDKVDDEHIWQLYKKHFNDVQIPEEEKPEESEWQKKRKEQARQHRKEQYQRQKEFKRRMKDGL